MPQGEAPRPAVRIGVVIPALNEEASVSEMVGRCLAALETRGEARIVVADNGSGDQTAARAAAAGAEVVTEPERGYGVACLTALGYLGTWPDLILFLDADGSSLPEEAPLLLEPLLRGDADLVLGVRPASSPMTPPQRWGTHLAVALVNRFWRSRYQDMGPFRAITRSALAGLGMTDRTWGWTIEMQILASEQRLRVVEIPVSWHHRLAGTSKISGTVSGVLKAGFRIVWTVGRYALRRSGSSPDSSRNISSR